MYIEQLISFFAYLLFVFAMVYLSSLVICGWYASTRGKTIIKADGTEQKTGYIFKFWYYLWSYSKGKIKIRYQGKALQSLIYHMKNQTGFDMIVQEDGHSFITVAEFKGKSAFLEDQYKVEFAILQVPQGYLVTVYDIEEDYFFPDAVRDVMMQCITCHASIYGSIFFWVLYAIIGNRVWFQIYYCFDVQWHGVLFTYISYVFALAYYGTVRWNKFYGNGGS